MRKLAILAIITIIGGFFYLVRDIGHVPMFDANINRLAETAAQGYCAGVTFWTNQGQPDAQKAAECRAETSYSTDINLAIVVESFCIGVQDSGYAGSVDDCVGIMNSHRWWPTYDGGIADAWNRAYPYPGDRVLVDTPQDNSRTGNRSGFNR